MPDEQISSIAISLKSHCAQNTRLTGLLQVRDEKASDLLRIRIQARVAAHNFGAVDAPHVKLARAPLQTNTGKQIKRGETKKAKLRNSRATFFSV
jgi:hypothetical protein